jgi:spore coat protein JB
MLYRLICILVFSRLVYRNIREVKHCAVEHFGQYFIVLIHLKERRQMAHKVVDPQQKALLRKLQEIDFVLVELNLYLDTHPSDEDALMQFNELALERDGIRAEYEKKYGPLMNFGHSFNRYPKGWNEGPWPWDF